MRRHYGRNMVACSILCQHSYWSALDRQNLFKQLLQPDDNEIIQARSKKNAVVLVFQCNSENIFSNFRDIAQYHIRIYFGQE